MSVDEFHLTALDFAALCCACCRLVPTTPNQGPSTLNSPMWCFHLPKCFNIFSCLPVAACPTSRFVQGQYTIHLQWSTHNIKTTQSIPFMLALHALWKRLSNSIRHRCTEARGGWSGNKEWWASSIITTFHPDSASCALSVHTVLWGGAGKTNAPCSRFSDEIIKSRLLNRFIHSCHQSSQPTFFFHSKADRVHFPQ